MKLRSGKSYMANYKKGDETMIERICALSNDVPPQVQCSKKKGSNKFIIKSKDPETENSCEVLDKPKPPREDGVLERYRLQFVEDSKPKPPREDGVIERYRLQFVQDNKPNGSNDCELLSHRCKKESVDICTTLIQNHLNDIEDQTKANPRLMKIKQFVPNCRNAPLMFDNSGRKIDIPVDSELFKSKANLHKRYGRLSKEHQEQVDSFFDITKNYQKFVVFSKPSITNFSFYFSSVIMVLQRIENMIKRRMDSALKRVVDRKSGLYVHCDPNTFFILNEVLCSEVQTKYTRIEKKTVRDGNWKKYVTCYELYWDGSENDPSAAPGESSFGKLPTLVNKYWWLREQDDRDEKMYRCVVNDLKLEYDVEFQQIWILFSYNNYLFTGEDWAETNVYNRGIINQNLEEY